MRNNTNQVQSIFTRSAPVGAMGALLCTMAALLCALAAIVPLAGASAAASLNAAGAEERMLAAQAGTWILTETVWDQPGAQPQVTNGLVVQRRMVGKLLEETLTAPPHGAVLRRDFLTWNRVEGRWQYMSFDTRAAVGMMTAQSQGAEAGGKIALVFQPFALPAVGAVTGRMLRMRQEIIRSGTDRFIKDQYFTPADGSGREWLAHRYDATRTR